jgi:hypothetical protein
MLQSHYSLFDSFFAPTRVLVVSEERLQQAEREAKQNQLDAIDARIEELTKYRTSLYAELKKGRVGKDLDQLDTMPSDYQPPGVNGKSGECDV